MSINLSYLEDCERARPNWTPEDGVASSFQELLITINEPLGFAWLAILALFIWKRNAWTGLLLAIFSIGVALEWNALKYNLDDDLYYGQLGGCVGSLLVANIVLLSVAAFGFVTFLVQWRRRKA